MTAVSVIPQSFALRFNSLASCGESQNCFLILRCIVFFLSLRGIRVRPNEIYRFTTFGSINGLLAKITQTISAYRNSFKISSIRREISLVSSCSQSAFNCFSFRKTRYSFSRTVASTFLPSPSLRRYSERESALRRYPHVDSKRFASHASASPSTIFKASNSFCASSCFREIPFEAMSPCQRRMSIIGS